MQRSQLTLSAWVFSLLLSSPLFAQEPPSVQPQVTEEVRELVRQLRAKCTAIEQDYTLQTEQLRLLEEEKIPALVRLLVNKEEQIVLAEQEAQAARGGMQAAQELAAGLQDHLDNTLWYIGGAFLGGAGATALIVHLVK